MAQKPTPLTFPNKPRNLKIGAELNRGAWGAVYHGELEGRPVAVKRIHELLHQEAREEERRKVFEDFREECKRLQALCHPHVVGFIGAFNDPRLGPILVMEKMQENLRQFLDKWKKKLQLPKQLRISLEIIRGVAFLHQQTPPLVHRDLNDKNVMFSFEGVVKIGDFGQSKLKKDLYLTSGQPGMVTFMPPEALDVDKSKYNESLDVFSIGVLMLEIGTQQEPLVNLRGIGTIREVERRERDLKVLGEDHPLRRPVLLCLKDNPKERPKASDLQRNVLAMVDGGAELREKEEMLKQLRAFSTGLEQELSKLNSHHEMAIKENTALKAQLQNQDKDIKAFKGIEGAFQRNIEKLNEKMKAMHLEHEDTLALLRQLKELSMAQKKELKEKEELLKHARGSCAGLEQKLSKLNSRHEMVIKENTALKTQLQNQENDIKAFRAIEGAYQKTFDEAKTYKELYHDAESKRSAAASRVTELTMVVNAMEAKGQANAGESVEALREQNQRMKRHYDTLEAAYQRVTSEKQQLAFAFQELQSDNEALQKENELLKGPRIMTAAHEMSLAPRSAQGGQFLLFQGSVGAVGILPKGGSDARGDVVGGRFAGDTIETDSPPGSGVGKKGPSSLELISVAPLPHVSLPEVGYTNAGRGVHPASDPRMPAGYPASYDLPQPIIGMSTDDNTEDSLPMPLTQPGVVPSLDDSLLSDFEANQRYIGEGINAEIRYEAHQYKKSEKDVVAAPAQVDDKDWPLDPNLTCPYCKVVFRRGQMREYRLHIDKCEL